MAEDGPYSDVLKTAKLVDLNNQRNEEIKIASSLFPEFYSEKKATVVTTPSPITMPNLSGIKTGADELFGDALFINRESVKLAKASNLATSDYAIIAQENTAPGFAIVVASSGSSSAGHRGVFKAVKASGSLASPAAPIGTTQNVFSLLGAIYDGTTTQATAGITFFVDGAVSSGIAPQRISFLTSQTDGASRTERMTITSGGLVGIGTSSPLRTLDISGNAIIDVPTGLAYLYLGNKDGGSNTKYAGIRSQNRNIFFGRSSDDFSAFVDHVIIDNTGLVGIGTTTPAVLFHVQNGNTRYNWTPTAGTVAIFEGTSSNRAFVNIVTGTNGQSEYWMSMSGSQGVGRIRYETDINKMEFWTTGAEQLSIMTSGSLQFTDATKMAGATNPGINLSGAMFVSGGALWYKGFADTITQLAPA